MSIRIGIIISFILHICVFWFIAKQKHDIPIHQPVPQEKPSIQATLIFEQKPPIPLTKKVEPTKLEIEKKTKTEKTQQVAKTNQVPIKPEKSKTQAVIIAEDDQQSSIKQIVLDPTIALQQLAQEKNEELGKEMSHVYSTQKNSPVLPDLPQRPSIEEQIIENSKIKVDCYDSAKKTMAMVSQFIGLAVVCQKQINPNIYIEKRINSNTKKRPN